MTNNQVSSEEIATEIVDRFNPVLFQYRGDRNRVIDLIAEAIDSERKIQEELRGEVERLNVLLMEDYLKEEELEKALDKADEVLGGLALYSKEGLECGCMRIAQKALREIQQMRGGV